MKGSIFRDIMLCTSVESQPTFWRNMPLWKLLHAPFLLDFFLDPEDGGHMFLQNISGLSMDYMAF
jgi:hypothetical protein